MTREEFLDTITDFDSLCNFCYEHGYEDLADEYHSGDDYDFWDSEATYLIDNYESCTM